MMSASLAEEVSPADRANFASSKSKQRANKKDIKLRKSKESPDESSSGKKKHKHKKKHRKNKGSKCDSPPLLENTSDKMDQDSGEDDAPPVLERMSLTETSHDDMLSTESQQMSKVSVNNEFDKEIDNFLGSDNDDTDDQLVIDARKERENEGGGNSSQKDFAKDPDCVIVETSQRGRQHKAIKNDKFNPDLKIKEEPNDEAPETNTSSNSDKSSTKAKQTVLLDCSYSEGLYRCHLCAYNNVDHSYFCEHLYSHIHPLPHQIGKNWLFSGSHVLCPICKSPPGMKWFTSASNYQACYYVKNTFQKLTRVRQQETETLQQKSGDQDLSSLPKRVIVLTSLPVQKYKQIQSMLAPQHTANREQAKQTRALAKSSGHPNISTSGQRMVSLLQPGYSIQQSSKKSHTGLHTASKQIPVPIDLVSLSGVKNIAVPVQASGNSGLTVHAKNTHQVFMVPSSSGTQKINIPLSVIPTSSQKKAIAGKSILKNILGASADSKSPQRPGTVTSKTTVTTQQDLNDTLPEDGPNLYLYCFVYDENRDKEMYLYTFTGGVVRCVHCGITFNGRKSHAMQHISKDIHRGKECTHLCSTSQKSTDSCHIIQDMQSLISFMMHSNICLADPKDIYCFTYKVTKKDFDKQKMYMNINITPLCSTVLTIEIKCILNVSGQETIINVSVTNGVYKCINCNYKASNSNTFRRHLVLEIHPYPARSCGYCDTSISLNRVGRCPVISDIFNILFFSAPEKDLSSMADIMKEITYLTVKSYNKTDQKYSFTLSALDQEEAPIETVKPVNVGAQNDESTGYKVVMDFDEYRAEVPNKDLSDNNCVIRRPIDSEDARPEHEKCDNDDEMLGDVVSILEGVGKAQKDLTSHLRAIKDDKHMKSNEQAFATLKTNICGDDIQSDNADSCEAEPKSTSNETDHCENSTDDNQSCKLSYVTEPTAMEVDKQSALIENTSKDMQSSSIESKEQATTTSIDNCKKNDLSLKVIEKSNLLSQTKETCSEPVVTEVSSGQDTHQAEQKQHSGDDKVEGQCEADMSDTDDMSAVLVEVVDDDDDTSLNVEPRTDDSIDDEEIGTAEVVVEPIENGTEETSVATNMIMDISGLTGTTGNPNKHTRFKCFLCCFKTYSREKLLPHMSLHSFNKTKKQAALHCTHCPFTHNNIDSFKGHLLSHDELKSIRLFNCEYCSFVSDNLDTIEQHLNSVHKNRAYRFIGTKIWHAAGMCLWCDAKYSADKIGEHIFLNHHEQYKFMMLEGILPPLSSATSNLNTTGKVRTDVSRTISKEDSSQLRQLLTNQSLLAHQADTQQSMLLKLSQADSNIANAAGGSFSCPYCAFNHRTESEWVQHVGRHIGQSVQRFQLFKCKTCKWTSTSNKKIVIHNMVVHKQAEGVVLTETVEIGPAQVKTQQMPTKYKCKECDFTSNNAAAFKGHMTGGVHTVKDATSIIAVRHTVSETESLYGTENSVTAPAVVTPPRASSPASSGSRSSRKRYICETCGYKTEKEGNIRTHVDIHKRCQEAESFFRCGRCLYDAVYRFAITKHSKRQHPDKEVLTLLIKKDGSQVCLRESGESMEEGALPATIPESPAKRESLEETSVEEQTVENSHNTTQPNTAASPVLDEWVLPYIHHASANQLQCKLCGYMQSNGIAALKRHIFAVHLNYKPYKCKYCEYAAVEPNKTERHLQSSHPTFPPRIVRLRFKGILPEIPKEAPEVARAIVQDEVSDDEMPVIIPDEEQDIDKKPEFGDEWRVGDPFPSSLSKTPKLASMLAGPPAVPSASSLLQNSNPKETLAFPNLSVERDPLQNLLSTENSSVPSPVANSSVTSTAHSKKQFHCVYCGYISKWGVKDVKTHIFSTHQKKYPFMCQHCNYGSRHQHLVRNHCFKSHPGKPQKIRNLILEYDSSFKMRTIDGVVHVATDEADLPVSAGSSADGSSSKAPSEHDGDDGLDEPVENKVQVDEDDEDDDSEYDVDDDDPAYRTHLPNSRMADYIWKCRECGYTKKAKVKVRYHILGRHLHLRPYKCGYCTFSHHTRWAVEDHVKTAHPNEKPNIQELMRESSEKIKSFLKKVKLKGRNPNELETMGGTGGIGGGPTAILTGDKDDTSKKMAKPTTAPTLTGMTGGGIYEDQHGMYCCDLCAYRSPTRNLVSKHRKTHFMYRPYGCGYCSFQAFCRTRIQTHNNKVHTGKPINIQMFDKPDKMVLSVLDKRLDRSLFTAEELSAASCYETTSGGGGHYDTGDKTAGDDGDDVIMGGDEDDFDEDDDDVSARSSTAMDDVAKDMPSIPQYSCNQCSFTSLKQQSMRHHVMGHLKYKPFKCPFCSLTYVKSFPIKKHIIAMHPTEDSGYIEHNKDPAMEENVKNMYSISAIKSNHATPAQDTSVPKEATKTGEHNTLEPVTRRLTGSVLYTCPMCGHMTDNTVSIRRHIMAELNYKPWQCPHCDYRDVQAGGIKRHCNIKHRLTSEFGVQKQDAEKEQMVQQLISQAKDGDKKKDVEMIDDDEDDESDMITLNGDDDSAPSAKQGGHLKVKLKGFSKRSPSDLSEEEPCKKKTRTEQESHLKMKMGNKPQKQPVVARPIEDFNMQDPESEGYMIPNDGLCVPKFLAQKNAHGGYSCRFCSYTTTKLGNFKEHLVRHTPHRFKCAYCQFTCQLTYDLRRHQRKMHPKGKDVIVKISDAEIEASQLASDRYPIAIKLARRDNESKSSAVTSTEATRKCGYCDFIGSSDTVTLHHKSKHKNRQLQLVDIETNKDDIHESDDHEEDSDESSSAQDSSGSETSESESDNDNDDDDDDDDGEDNNEDDESSESSDDDNDSSSDDDDNNGDNNDENDDDPEVSFKSSTLAASVAHIAADDDDDDADDDDDDDDDDDSNEDEPIIPQHISDPGEEAAEHYMSRPPTADDGEPGRRRSSRKSCERLPSSSHSSDFRSVRPQATQQETEDAVTSLLQPSPQATARGGGGDRNNRRSAERYKRSTVLPPSAGIMVVDLQETEAAVSGLE